jgi:hypothetical protein
VDQGQILGLVGLSGKTEFPHLHFEVRLKGVPIDPFLGKSSDDRCGNDNGASLWSATARRRLPYRSTAMIQAGFSDRRPELPAIESRGGNMTSLAADAEAIAFWVEVLGTREGDEGHLAIYGPGEQVLAQHVARFSKDQARWFGFVGKKRRAGTWPGGSYRGEFRLFRRALNGENLVLDESRRTEVRPLN